MVEVKALVKGQNQIHFRGLCFGMNFCQIVLFFHSKIFITIWFLWVTSICHLTKDIIWVSFVLHLFRPNFTRISLLNIITILSIFFSWNSKLAKHFISLCWTLSDWWLFDCFIPRNYFYCSFFIMYDYIIYQFRLLSKGWLL